MGDDMAFTGSNPTSMVDSYWNSMERAFGNDTHYSGDSKVLEDVTAINRASVHAPYMPICEQYIPPCDAPDVFKVLDIIQLDNKHYELCGRWMSERVKYAESNIIDVTSRNRVCGVLVDKQYEQAISERWDFVICLDDQIEHDIDPCVEYFGYLRALKIHCFRYNLQRGKILFHRRAMVDKIPEAPVPPPIRYVKG